MSAHNIPDFRVTLGDRDLTGFLRGTVRDSETARPRPRLVSLSISEKRGEEADELDIVIDDTDGRVDLPPEGAILHVHIGWKQGGEVTPGLVDKGSFTVDEVSHAGPPDLITIKGRSADFIKDLKLRREKGHADTTLGAIVADIAKRHGLKPRCAPALASIAVKAKAQSRESDMAFLRRLGRENDAAATIKAGILILKPIGDGSSAAGEALPALTIRRRDGDGHSFTRAKREEAEGVTAEYHDRGSARRESVTVGKGDGRKLARVYATRADAEAAAKATKGRAARQPVTMSMTLALGRADIFPEQRATVSGYKPQIDAVRWLVTEVTHAIGERGYSTTLKLENAA